jgi:hypothetical protein
LYFVVSYGNNVCHNASKGAGVVTIGAPSSTALQLSAGIPKHKAHLMSWKSIFSFFSLKILWICKSLLMLEKY